MKPRIKPFEPVIDSVNQTVLFPRLPCWTGDAIQFYLHNRGLQSEEFEWAGGTILCHTSIALIPEAQL